MRARQGGIFGDEASAPAAQLNSPAGLAFDARGNLFIADSGYHRVRMISIDGMMHTVAGTGTADFAGDGGPALDAALNTPAGLASDATETSGLLTPATIAFAVSLPWDSQRLPSSLP